jgi:DNA polymerase-3 subunit alpha
MVKYHIDSELIGAVKECDRYAELTDAEHEKLYQEIKNAVLQKLESKILSLRGPGSASLQNPQNSLLLWVLGITNEKPTGNQKIKSPGSYADFDVDFSKEQRGKVYEYLYEKYGKERVTHVVTFNTMAAKAAVRSAARVLEFSVEEGGKIAKQIPNVPDIKLQEAIDGNSVLQDLQKEAVSKRILEIAFKLEGLPSNLGVHASACVISENPLTDYMPLMLSTKASGGEVLTQFEYYDVEAIGCLKWDILGLKTLDVIKNTCELVKSLHKVSIDIDAIDLEDPKLFETINDGWNTGIFQFESDIFASAVQKVKPASLLEISDITSLNRPGPISMGMLEQYVTAKFEGTKYEYDLTDRNLIEKVWEICKGSYGLLVYQEQVIKCFTEIAGFNEIEGDNARRAMGKKKPEEMAKLLEGFVEGGKRLGYDEKDLAELFRQIEGFSGYGFNKSHSIAYSIITCQTLFLSTYYPLEFYATLLTVDHENTDDVRRYINALKLRGFTISAPRINTSEASFTLSKTGITFGLSGIKGVGVGVSNKILKKRPKKGYKSLGDFILRNFELINKKVLESYAKAGCFVEFGINKISAIRTVDNILDFIDIQKSIKDYNTIFDMVDIDLAEYFNTCKVTHVDKEDPLSFEIETLGLYITKHPMEGYIVNDLRDSSNIIDIIKRYESGEIDNGDKVSTVGAICAINVRKTKSKTNMATFTLTSESHSVTCVVFPQQYSRFQHLIEEGKMVHIAGQLKSDDGILTLMINHMSENVQPYMAKIEKFVPFKKAKLKYITDINDFTGGENETCITIGDLTFVLTKEIL